MTEECINCKFYRNHVENAEGSKGRCKRFPPASIDPTWKKQCTADGDYAGYPESTPGWWSYPAVWFDDWCGEFKPVKKSPTKSINATD